MTLSKRPLRSSSTLETIGPCEGVKYRYYLAGAAEWFTSLPSVTERTGEDRKRPCEHCILEQSLGKPQGVKPIGANKLFGGVVELLTGRPESGLWAKASHDHDIPPFINTCL